MEVIVGVRENDAESRAVLAEFNHSTGGVVREAVVGESDNLAASLNTALQQTTGGFVALTDDDAEPPPEWLGKLGACFDDPTIGGAGGRDWQPEQRWDEQEVGFVRWWGKVIGNHHLGAGPPRDVHLLKGVNCCFRGDALREIGIDSRLRGKGNVSHWEISLSFAFLRRKWRLVYDPAIQLDHHIGPRHDGDVNARGGFARDAFVDSVHNSALALLEFLPEPRRTAWRAWRTILGSRSEPGALQVPRLLLIGKPAGEVWCRFLATRAGHRAALQTWRASRKPPKPSIRLARSERNPDESRRS